MLDTKDKSLMGEVVLYNPTEEIRLDVKLEEETVWLTQPQMVLLFESSKANISEHLKNIYSQGELTREATVRKFRTVRQEGERTVTRNIEYYNLDAIISVGFRVNSKAGIAFRQWANRVLKEHILRGYSINKHLISLQERTDERFLTTESFKEDIERHNRQYAQIEFIQLPHKNHDRFLIIDNEAYLLGASIKDMGSSMSAITKMQMSPDVILSLIR